jgi:hypothetical protein
MMISEFSQGFAASVAALLSVATLISMIIILAMCTKKKKNNDTVDEKDKEIEENEAGLRPGRSKRPKEESVSSAEQHAMKAGQGSSPKRNETEVTSGIENTNGSKGSNDGETTMPSNVDDLLNSMKQINKSPSKEMESNNSDDDNVGDLPQVRRVCNDVIVF